MKLRSVVVLCLLWVDYVSAFVWEFGTHKVGTERWTTNGVIFPFQKHTVIHVPVPECDRLTYVRVEIINYISTPTVVLDKAVNNIHINYDLLSSSASTYNIIAKSVNKCSYKSDGINSTVSDKEHAGSAKGSDFGKVQDVGSHRRSLIIIPLGNRQKSGYVTNLRGGFDNALDDSNIGGNTKLPLEVVFVIPGGSNQGR